MPQVNFYRGSYTTTRILELCQINGNIVFDNNTNRIYAGTTGSGQTLAPKPYGSNVIDAVFDQSVLTITKLDGATVTLDFGDVASATSTMSVFTQLKNIMGIDDDDTAPDYSSDASGILHKTGHGETDAASLVEADLALAAAIANAGQVDDVQVNGTTIVANKVADIAVDGIYNSSSNKIATETTVSSAIDALDVNTDKGGASISGSTLTINGVQQEDGYIKDGGSTTINLDGTYDASTNKIATKSTVTDAIGGLDVNTDKGGATISGSTLTIKAVQETDGLIEDGGTTTINLDGSYDASTNKIATQSTVSDALAGLDGTATIASESNGVVTIKTGVAQTNGEIDNDSGTDITLAKVATTGAAEDVTITDAEGKITATTVEGALTELATAIAGLQGDFDVIKSTDAATTPAGVTWVDDNEQTITGTLAASATTFHKVYLVKSGGAGTNQYSEYITTKTTNGSIITYGWEKLGDIDIDLTGYVKTITINGKVYSVDSNSTNITLTDVITAITGETAISGGNSDLVAVTATTTKNTTTGANETAITSTVKIEEVADGLTADSTNVYSDGHYVIENGKLVSAAGKSSGQTYTKSSNDGLTTASDVQAYVNSAIQNAQLQWSEWS